MFTYNSSSTNSKLVVGDIYMKYKENNSLDAKYGSYLEDTEWCNDRSVASLGGWAENGK